MKTVKEYANSVGKSHQSVYKQLNSKKNKERLESHVWKQDGTTYWNSSCRFIILFFKSSTSFLKLALSSCA